MQVLKSSKDPRSMIISYCAPDGAPGYGGGAPREGGGPFEEAEEPPGACWYRWMMRVIADQSIQGKERN